MAKRGRDKDKEERGGGSEDWRESKRKVGRKGGLDGGGREGVR